MNTSTNTNTNTNTNRQRGSGGDLGAGFWVLIHGVALYLNLGLPGARGGTTRKGVGWCRCRAGVTPPVVDVTVVRKVCWRGHLRWRLRCGAVGHVCGFVFTSNVITGLHCAAHKKERRSTAAGTSKPASTGSSEAPRACHSACRLRVHKVKTY